MNISNCYEKCDNYYYFDENNIFQCNKTCPENYKLIEQQNRCILNCENDNIYKLEYGNKCYISCPNGTYSNDDDKINQKDSETKISSVFSDSIIITYNIGGDERDKDIQNFRNNVYDYNISESKEDKVEVKNGVIYQVTTSDNQKNNSNKNISTLDLGDCEQILKTEYGIDPSLPLIYYIKYLFFFGRW